MKHPGRTWSGRLPKLAMPRLSSWQYVSLRTAFPGACWPEVHRELFPFYVPNKSWTPLLESQNQRRGGLHVPCVPPQGQSHLLEVERTILKSKLSLGRGDLNPAVV